MIQIEPMGVRTMAMERWSSRYLGKLNHGPLHMLFTRPHLTSQGKSLAKKLR